MGVPEPISIHAPLTGCDLRSAHQDSGTSYFNPRTPYGVRPCQVHLPLCPQHISIHAPLAGCDFPLLLGGLGFHISIHAPLAGCDFVSGGVLTVLGIFQSTHPLRDATFSPGS